MFHHTGSSQRPGFRANSLWPSGMRAPAAGHPQTSPVCLLNLSTRLSPPPGPAFPLSFPILTVAQRNLLWLNSQEPSKLGREKVASHLDLPWTRCGRRGRAPPGPTVVSLQPPKGAPRGTLGGRQRRESNSSRKSQNDSLSDRHQQWGVWGVCQFPRATLTSDLR